MPRLRTSGDPLTQPTHMGANQTTPASMARSPVILSSGRTGQCWDNALAESLFASLKGECLDHQPWPTRTAPRRATVQYVAWYNGTRLHSALGYMTPDEFETTTDQKILKQVA
jgi:putative transposase